MSRQQKKTGNIERRERRQTYDRLGGKSQRLGTDPQRAEEADRNRVGDESDDDFRQA